MDRNLMSESNWQEIRSKALQLPHAQEDSNSISFQTMLGAVICIEKDGTLHIEGDCICFLTPAKMLMFVLAFLPPKE